MLSEHKLDSADFLGKNVSSLPDRPSEAGMTAAELKAAFDRGGEEVIASHFNDLIDTLSGNEGASEIGTGDGRTVEERLDSCVESENISKLYGMLGGVLLLEENGQQSSVGYRIQQGDTVYLPNRKVLAFLNATVTDDSQNDRLFIDTNAVMSVNQKSGSHIMLSSEDVGAVSDQVFSAHTADKKNPHGVTAQQIGALTRQELTPLGFDLTLMEGVSVASKICRQWGPLVSINAMFFINDLASGTEVKIAEIARQFAPQDWITCCGMGRTASGELMPVCVNIDGNGNILVNSPVKVQYVSMSLSWMQGIF